MSAGAPGSLTYTFREGNVLGGAVGGQVFGIHRDVYGLPTLEHAAPDPQVLSLSRFADDGFERSTELRVRVITADGHQPFAVI